MQIIKKH